MRLSRVLAAAFIVGLAFVSSGNAATLDLTGTNYDLGVVAVGQTGTITTTPISVSTHSSEYGFVLGMLAPKSVVIFTYTDTTSFEPGQLVSNSSYNDPINGFDITASSGGSPSSAVASTLPVIVTANISTPKNGTTTITNSSLVAVNFLSYFLGGKSFKGATVTYSVSSVPLPSAAVLFMLGLVAIAGFASYRHIRGQA